MALSILQKLVETNEVVSVVMLSYCHVGIHMMCHRENMVPTFIHKTGNT